MVKLPFWGKLSSSAMDSSFQNALMTGSNKRALVLRSVLRSSGGIFSKPGDLLFEIEPIALLISMISGQSVNIV